MEPHATGSREPGKEKSGPKKKNNEENDSIEDDGELDKSCLIEWKEKKLPRGCLKHDPGYSANNCCKSYLPFAFYLACVPQLYMCIFLNFKKEHKSF